ncbi:MAG: YfcE family phosphodiesterase [Parcubacteria group bacterium]|nr:YfcE family phosphodiesterase [Parcubacteria group bacterium]
MKFAIISDSHDNVPNIDKALAHIKKQNIKTIVHCGDVCAPGVMKYIAEQYNGEIHLTYGNVDGDRELMEELAADLDNMTIHGEVGKIELGGKKIVWNHYPEEAKDLAKEGKYDLSFYGHTHQPWEEKIGNTLVLNPGTLAGLFAKATFAIYDTAEDKAELIILEKI